MLGYVILLAVLLLLGIVFALGKGSFLIAGYNTMSEQEKAQYDERKILKGMSAMMFSCAACMALAALGIALGAEVLTWIGYLLLVPVVILFVIRVNIVGKR